jgi:hypothetical protein
MRPRKFRVHFNRIAMQRKQPEIWSVQLSDRCLHAAHVDILVPCATVFQPDKKENPRAFFVGLGVARLRGNRVVITES